MLQKTKSRNTENRTKIENNRDEKSILGGGGQITTSGGMGKQIKSVRTIQYTECGENE